MSFATGTVRAVTTAPSPPDPRAEALLYVRWLRGAAGRFHPGDDALGATDAPAPPVRGASARSPAGAPGVPAAASPPDRRVATSGAPLGAAAASGDLAAGADATGADATAAGATSAGATSAGATSEGGASTPSAGPGDPAGGAWGGDPRGTGGRPSPGALADGPRVPPPGAARPVAPGAMTGGDSASDEASDGASEEAADGGDGEARGAAARHVAAPQGGGSGDARPAGPAPDAAGGDALADLRAVASACRRCRLCETRTQVVFGEGPGRPRLMVIGEAPGADEDASGRPFVGAAGQLLTRMLGAIGLAREDVYIANVLKCRPPGNRPPGPDEMAACRPYLEEQIRRLDPELILLLGGPATKTVLATERGITAMRGQVLRTSDGRPAIPTFHPAYLLRTPEAKREAWLDLQLVAATLGLSVPPRSA